MARVRDRLSARIVQGLFVAGVVVIAAAYWVVVAQPRVSTDMVGPAVPLRVLTLHPSDGALGLVDLATGVVIEYPPSTHALGGQDPDGAVFMPRGEAVLWVDGRARVFAAGLDSVDGELRPDPLRQLDGVAPALQVVPTTDGEVVWLVQPGVHADADGHSHPTVIERVALEHEDRSAQTRLDERATAVAATATGLVLNTDQLTDTGDGWVTTPGSEQVMHLDRDGSVQEVGSGRAVAAAGARVIRLVCAADEDPCALHVSAPDGGDDWRVEAPRRGRWAVGGLGAMVPGQTLPPGAVAPDGSQLLAWLGEDFDAKGKPSRSSLFTVDLEDASVTPVTEVDGAAPASTWSRDGRWIVLLHDRGVTLIDGEDPAAGARTVDGVIPDGHVPLAAG